MHAFQAIILTDSHSHSLSAVWSEKTQTHIWIVCWAMMLKSESITVFEVNCNKKKPYYARNDLSSFYWTDAGWDCLSVAVTRMRCCWHSCCFIFTYLGNKNKYELNEKCECVQHPILKRIKNSHNYNKQRCLRVYKSLKYISNMSSPTLSERSIRLRHFAKEFVFGDAYISPMTFMDALKVSCQIGWNRS